MPVPNDSVLRVYSSEDAPGWALEAIGGPMPQIEVEGRRHPIRNLSRLNRTEGFVSSTDPRLRHVGEGRFILNNIEEGGWVSNIDMARGPDWTAVQPHPGNLHQYANFLFQDAAAALHLTRLMGRTEASRRALRRPQERSGQISYQRAPEPPFSPELAPLVAEFVDFLRDTPLTEQEKRQALAQVMGGERMLGGQTLAGLRHSTALVSTNVARPFRPGDELDMDLDLIRRLREGMISRTAKEDRLLLYGSDSVRTMATATYGGPAHDEFWRDEYQDFFRDGRSRWAKREQPAQTVVTRDPVDPKNYQRQSIASLEKWQASGRSPQARLYEVAVQLSLSFPAPDTKEDEEFYVVLKVKKQQRNHARPSTMAQDIHVQLEEFRPVVKMPALEDLATAIMLEGEEPQPCRPTGSSDQEPTPPIT